MRVNEHTLRAQPSTHSHIHRGRVINQNSIKPTSCLANLIERQPIVVTVKFNHECIIRQQIGDLTEKPTSNEEAFMHCVRRMLQRVGWM